MMTINGRPAWRFDYLADDEPPKPLHTATHAWVKLDDSMGQWAPIERWVEGGTVLVTLDGESMWYGVQDVAYLSWT